MNTNENSDRNCWKCGAPATVTGDWFTDQLDDQMLHVLRRNIEWAGGYPGTNGTGGWFVPRYGATISSIFFD